MDKHVSERKEGSEFTLGMKGVVVISPMYKDYLILIRPENGSWITVDQSESEPIRSLLEKEMTFRSYKETYPHKLELLKRLFESGLLKIDGKAFIKENIFDHPADLPDYPFFIVVKYTRKCNLKCSYCYAVSKEDSSGHMSNETVLYILKKMIAAYGNRKFHLTLHGGEPTLRYKDIGSLMKSIRLMLEDITVSLQTNATLVGKEMAEFFKREKIRVGVSVDGCDEKSNLQRCFAGGRSSLEESLEGLQNLLSVGMSPGILTVVTSANQYRIAENFDFYIYKGVRKFGFNVFFPAGRGENNTYEIDIDNWVATNLELIKKINAFNKQCHDPAKYIRERGVGNLIHNLTSRRRSYMCALSPCGAGRMTLAFDTDGSIYPCDDFISQKDFCLGNIFQIDNLRDVLQQNYMIRRLKDHQVNRIKECLTCPWKRICTMHCVSDSFFYHKTFNRPHSMCLYMKKIIPAAIDLLHSRQIDPRYFLLC